MDSLQNHIKIKKEKMSLSSDLFIYIQLHKLLSFHISVLQMNLNFTSHFIMQNKLKFWTRTISNTYELLNKIQDKLVNWQHDERLYGSHFHADHTSWGNINTTFSRTTLKAISNAVKNVPVNKNCIACRNWMCILKLPFLCKYIFTSEV